jgi:RNA polymerase sigma-70 factor (ECF subfamily)
VADEITEAALRARSGDSASARAFVSATQTDVWRLCAHLSSRSFADDLTTGDVRACVRVPASIRR